MDNLTILVCVYNKNIISSSTIQSILKSSSWLTETKICIWDNSVISFDDESLSVLRRSFRNLIYKHTPENLALSKIYNAVIAEQNDTSSYLMLCDDDSEIPSIFFEELNKQIKLHPAVNLFLPQIYSNDILISPAKDYLVKTKLINDLKEGLCLSKNTIAINSGMVISNRVFIDGFRYNESLNFYGTDNYFMYQYSKKYRSFAVLDVKIKHDLNFNTSDCIVNKLRIFKEIKRANRIIYSDNVFKKSLVIFNNFIVSLKLCAKYRTLAFLYG